jgi:FKBP12-rapamycin complex-associated protein
VIVFSNLLGILLGFLQTETVKPIRRETIKILGLIGAIDPFEFKQTLLKSQRAEVESAAASAAIQQLHQSQIQQMQQAIGMPRAR